MRVWEIREGREHAGDYRVGMRDKYEKSEKEAYECGYEDGYEKAIEEMTRERSGYRSSYRTGYRRDW